jgi:vancomycin resistance protein YoaR
VREGISRVIGDLDLGSYPVNARFSVIDDKVTIIPSKDGVGIDFVKVTRELNTILFDDPNAVRLLSLSVGPLTPTRTTQNLTDMHVTEKIASYTTRYPNAAIARITNIHLVSDLLTNSLIAPGDEWSFNGTAGECNAEKGFQAATAISDNEYIDEIGGGICQVATTIFNVIFDSGFPIVERVNHSQYIASYPDGRDATVSWPSPDLKFQNDTEDWLLLSLSYTNDSVTATLWGTNPGYIVEYEKSDWSVGEKYPTKEIENPDMLVGEKKVKQKGKDGAIITITRYVYDRKGNLLREGRFRSTYKPETEIVEIGTKKSPATDTNTPQTPSTGSTGGGSP